MILGAKEFFQEKQFAEAVPVLLAQAIKELDALMPTRDQIGASRDCSPDRYFTVRPIKVFESLGE